MTNVCPHCGIYRDDKIIDHAASTATCPECGHTFHIELLPLYIITGSSGVGKTAITAALTGDQRFVVMEADVMFCPELNDPTDNYKRYWSLWLRLCKNIQQSGRSVILTGQANPEQLARCAESRYFSEINFLALVCTPDEQRRRLLARPSWRGASDESQLAPLLAYNQWFIDHAQEQEIALVDTTNVTIKQTVEQVRVWLDEST